MRVCHGLTGDFVDVDDAELQWRKPIDVVRHHAKERWNLLADDLIVLASKGQALGPETGPEGLGQCQNVYFFSRTVLNPEADVAPELLEPGPPGEPRLRPIADADEDLDPAFEAFRANVAEAARRIAESLPVSRVASRAAAKLEIQRLAGQAVLDNLTSHRATCSRSITLFVQKFERVQERFDQNLSKVDAAMAALGTIALHPALRSEGREFLSDVVPKDRILRFTAGLQAERARINQRMEKLRRQDAQTKALCDQVEEKVRQLLADDSVSAAAKAIVREQERAEQELLPALRAVVPKSGAPSASVLEEERRSREALAGLARSCQLVQASLSELQACWDRQSSNFLQRLREVSYIQSRVRNVERQAALLEEEVNVQRNYSQQLSRLQKMPKAYHRALGEVACRRQFKTQFLSHGEKVKSSLAKMVDEENTRRRAFLQRYGAHLPADLVQGLGSLVPPASIQIPDFDGQLPDVDVGSLAEGRWQGASREGGRERNSPASSGSSQRTPAHGASSSAAASAVTAGRPETLEELLREPRAEIKARDGVSDCSESGVFDDPTGDTASR